MVKLKEDGNYICNLFTELFIKVSMELKLLDPKVLLRCGVKTLDELLGLVWRCISIGIGDPFLSNEDTVISVLISCGYDQQMHINMHSLHAGNP